MPSAPTSSLSSATPLSGSISPSPSPSVPRARSSTLLPVIVDVSSTGVPPPVSVSSSSSDEQPASARLAATTESAKYFLITMVQRSCSVDWMDNCDSSIERPQQSESEKTRADRRRHARPRTRCRIGGRRRIACSGNIDASQESGEHETTCTHYNGNHRPAGERPRPERREWYLRRKTAQLDDSRNLSKVGKFLPEEFATA